MRNEAPLNNANQSPSGVWSGVVGRFVSFFRSITHRDTTPPTWGELEDHLRQIDPRILEKFTPIEAEHKTKELRRIFAWHLEQPPNQHVQRELFLILAILDLVSQGNSEAHVREQQALRPTRPHATVDRQAVRRVTQLHLCLARLLLERNEKARALEQAHQAVKSHCLGPGDWKTVVDVLLQCDYENESSFNVCLEYLIRARSADKNLMEHLMAPLKEKMISAEMSHPEREKALLRLRRLHLAAPWLNWPLVRLAENDIKNNQLTSAERKLETIYPVIEDELKSDVALLLGQIAFCQEEYEKADRCFDTALKSGADLVSVFEFMGVAKARLGSFDEALECIDKALGVSVSDTYLLLQKANVLLCQDRLREAHEIYAWIIQIDPGATDATFGLGKIEEIKGNLSYASELYRQILVAKPNHIPAQFSLGLICLKEQNEEEAENYFQRVLAINPVHLPTLLEMGIMRVRKGIQGDQNSLTQGMELLRTCEQAQYPDERLTYWLGRALGETKDYSGCLACWEPLLANDQIKDQLQLQIERVRFWLAIKLGIDGETESAARLLQELSPEIQKILPVEHFLCRLKLSLAQRALLNEQPAKCSELVAKVLSIQPENPKARLLQVLQRFNYGQISRAEIFAITNTMHDGEERELCKLLHWLHGRQLNFDLVEDEDLWANVERGAMPQAVLNDAALGLFDLSYRLMARRKNGFPIDTPDIELTIQLADQLPNNECFSQPDLAWWLARLVLESRTSGRYEQLLHTASRDDSPLSLALDLVHLNDRKLDGEVALLEYAAKVEDQRLLDFIVRSLCYAAQKEIQKIGKDPVRINRAHALLEQAIELV